MSIEYGNYELSEKVGLSSNRSYSSWREDWKTIEYTTDDDNNVYIGGLNSYIGRVGFVAGQKTVAMMSISRHRRCMNLEATGIFTWQQPMEKPCRCQKTTATHGLK